MAFLAVLKSQASIVNLSIGDLIINAAYPGLSEVRRPNSKYLIKVISIVDIDGWASRHWIFKHSRTSSTAKIKAVNMWLFRNYHQLSLDCDTRFDTQKNKGGNRGGLIYPSDDVITICLQTEKVLRSFNYKNKSVNALFEQSKVLSHFLHNTNIFSSLNFHRKESYSPLSHHVTLLIKSISTTYIKIKINYSLKALNEKPSLRMWYNKLTLFQGQ